MELVRPQDIHPESPGPDRFTAGVLQETVFESPVEEGMRFHRFTYPSGGHSHWHIHRGEQGLFVVIGRGWVKFEGEERIEVGPGDMVYVAPGRRHWHGATANHLFVHLAFTASGATDWGGQVTEAQYREGTG